MALQNIDPLLSQPSRFFIIASMLAGGGRALYSDLARQRQLFGSAASLTLHNAILHRAGYLNIEKAGPRRRPHTSMVLTDLGRRKARAHLAALRDLMECSG